MPSADSCGDPFPEKHIEGLLPVVCGVEAVLNYSWEKETVSYGSGADDEATTTTIFPPWTLLSAAAHHRTTHSTTAHVVGSVSVTPNRSATRLPPRFTPNPEIRNSNFQHLLRIHLNTFNQRLTMLERNTLDMKESMHNMEDQQIHLSSQLKELITIQSAGEKNKKVSELENSYTDMDTRLGRLEGRLEILIDGFTALAQEMNKMKRGRHVSRSPQEKRALPSLTRVIPTEMPFTSRATVPRSIPAPGLANKATSASRKARKLKLATTTTPVKTTDTSKSPVSTRSTMKFRTNLSKPKTTSKSNSKATVKPKTKRPEGRTSAGTVKRVSQPKKLKQVEETITTFQLVPPSYKLRPSKPGQANKKESLPAIGHKKAFRSDAPITKKVQESGKPSEGNSKNLSKKNSAKNTVSTTKPTRVATAKKSKTTAKRTTTTAGRKATTAKKKSKTTAKRKSSPPKTKVSVVKKVTKKKQQKKEQRTTQSGILELLRLLQGDHKSAKRKKNLDGSLHVVVGRLAIPIKIIPDD